MPKIDPEMMENAHAILKRTKVFVFNQLLSLLNCSIRSGRLKLKQWSAYNSYNQNGRYYTLPGVPLFDENGLWHYKEIYFSKHGTLKNTVIHLINQSPAGLTGHQIGRLVKISPRSFLHHFQNAPGICREKHGGVYVYFSDEEKIYGRQVENHLKDLMSTEQQLTDADAIVILTALIKRHQIGVDRIMSLPEIKARGFSRVMINEFLDRHNLVKKKAITEP